MTEDIFGVLIVAVIICLTPDDRTCHTAHVYQDRSGLHSFCRFLELVLGFLIIRIFIRMILHRKFAIRFLTSSTDAVFSTINIS